VVFVLFGGEIQQQLLEFRLGGLFGEGEIVSAGLGLASDGELEQLRGLTEDNSAAVRLFQLKRFRLQSGKMKSLAQLGLVVFLEDPQFGEEGGVGRLGKAFGQGGVEPLGADLLGQGDKVQFFLVHDGSFRWFGG